MMTKTFNVGGGVVKELVTNERPDDTKYKKHHETLEKEWQHKEKIDTLKKLQKNRAGKSKEKTVEKTR